MNEYETEDLIVKLGKFRFYFQNYYTIISLINDLLLGALYFIGSMSSIIGGPQWIQKLSYLAGAVFLLMRPILKIFRNIFIYDKEEYQNKVSDIGFGGKERRKKDSKTKKSDGDYGESKSQNEKMDKIHQEENNTEK